MADILLKIGGLFQIYIKLQNENMGKWFGGKPVLSYDKKSANVSASSKMSNK